MNPTDSAREILQERARRLARPLAARGAAPAPEAIAFRVAGERYAVAAHDVVEVFRLERLTRLPGAARPMAGMTAWRGGLLALYWLGQAGTNEPSVPGRVLVLGEGERRLGVLADEVEGLVQLDPGELRPPPASLADREPYLCAVTGDAVIVLDADVLIRTHTTAESDP